MAESIKIYRKANKRLGFEVDNLAIANLYIDDQALKKLVEHMNRYFYICEDQQSQSLLKGTIDPNSAIVTTLSLLLFIPIVKALFFENFEYIVWEYALILLLGGGVTLREFWRCDGMRERYERAEEQRNATIEEIASEFNRRFEYLKMEFNIGVDQNEEGFMEIKFYKDKLHQQLADSAQPQIAAE